MMDVLQRAQEFVPDVQPHVIQRTVTILVTPVVIRPAKVLVIGPVLVVATPVAVVTNPFIITVTH